ncbi:MAG TPA: hypothetical protein VGH28_11685 [Polyangiaceae bacterium]|jgi:hypothetical protein
MRFSKLAATGFVAFIVACAANSSTVDPLSDLTPRAQGIISLGATHTPGSGTVSPSVSVSFVPDTTAVLSACGTQTEGTCVFTQAPDCTNLGCKVGETCGWDDSCSSACVPACTLSCGENQKCTKGSDGSQSCTPIQTFDAGAIAISGANLPIAVYPPYGWKTSDEGSPYAPGADLHVTAAGPTGAGYASFDLSFKATTLLEANPSLDKLNLSDVFGDSDLTVGWLPGNDRVYVLATGAGGEARCLANDSDGTFTVPRDVLTAVMTDKVQALQLSIERMRLDRHQDLKTVGSLDSQTIQSHAWLDLETTSTETMSFQACTSTQTSCGAKCVDTKSDPDNCGSCGNSCNGGSCLEGSCQSTTGGGSCGSCQAGANTGECASPYAQCTGECKSLLSCVEGCAGDTTCASNCYSTYPSGQSAFTSYYSCLCGSACPTECSTECGG